MKGGSTEAAMYDRLTSYQFVTLIHPSGQPLTGAFWVKAHNIVAMQQSGSYN